jgi:DNA-binding NarL/FixJ family response regulator
VIDLETVNVRVILVDDYTPYRLFVSSTLQKHPKLQIVSEVGDGFKAVLKARELKPDLILMDIGIPTINGIEAARQILEILPETKILFVTENRSSEIAEQAFRIGASGYVVKSNAASELLPAVEAVLQGKRFVSAGIEGSSELKQQSVERISLLQKALEPG